MHHAPLDFFFRKRDKDFVDKVFESNKDSRTNLLPLCTFKSSLAEFGIDLENDEAVTSLFNLMDVNNDCGLDRDEFERAIQTPTKLEQWTATIPVHQLLASCLSVQSGIDPLRRVSRLDSSEKEEVEQVFFRGFQRLFTEYSEKLQHLYFHMDKKASEQSQGLASKFTFVPSSGGIEDFHEGLKSRVGKLQTKNRWFFSVFEFVFGILQVLRTSKTLWYR
jgi:hypothetical protein